MAASALRIEQGRFRKELVAERVCENCEGRHIEDEIHFMLNCAAYSDLREEMWKEFEAVTRASRESYASETDQLNALIGDKFHPKVNDEKDSRAWQNYKEIAKLIMKFITKAMNRRRGLQNSGKGQVLQ